MSKALRTYPPYKLSAFLTKLSANETFTRQNSCSTEDPDPKPRGLLPWEKEARGCEQAKQFRKKKVDQEITQERGCECGTLQRPMRNSYEWVVEDPPEGAKTVFKKTVCELRRLRKCLRFFGGDEKKCQNLAPACNYSQKVYPMLEIAQKPPLPGCPKPIQWKRKEEKSEATNEKQKAS